MAFLLPALASVGGSLIGKAASSGDRDKAQAALDAAAQEILNIGAPPDLSAEIIREKLKQVGVYTPQMEEDIQVEASKLSQIQEDPTLRDAQSKALQLLQSRSETGLGPEERAAFNQLRREAAKESEGKRQQILQNMAQRGMAGSGAELAAQLSASQAGDEALAAEGDRIAAAAAAASRDAISRAAGLAGQVRSQDFDVSSTKARAEDELNRFNTQNQIARQSRNISALNEAQLANLREQQRIADLNVAQSNEEKLRQAKAKEDFWKNKLAQASARAGVYNKQAEQASASAQETADMFGGIGSGLGGALGTYQKQQREDALIDRLYPKKEVGPIRTLTGSEDEEERKASSTGNLFGGTRKRTF